MGAASHAGACNLHILAFVHRPANILKCSPLDAAWQLHLPHDVLNHLLNQLSSVLGKAANESLGHTPILEP